MQPNPIISSIAPNPSGRKTTLWLKVAFTAWMAPGLYLLTWLIVLFGVLYVPAHLLLKRLFAERLAR